MAGYTHSLCVLHSWDHLVGFAKDGIRSRGSWHGGDEGGHDGAKDDDGRTHGELTERRLRDRLSGEKGKQ